MAIDLAVLAATVVSKFLVPYAKMGAKKLAEGVAKVFGSTAADEVSDVSEQLWNKAQSALSSDAEKVVFSEFKSDPDAAKSLVEAKLKAKLADDTLLAQELDKLVNKRPVGSSSTGAQIMDAYIAGIVDLREADLSHASNFDIAAVRISGTPPEESDRVQQKALDPAAAQKR
jgi:hypothetical protein